MNRFLLSTCAIAVLFWSTMVAGVNWNDRVGRRSLLAGNRFSASRETAVCRNAAAIRHLRGGDSSIEVVLYDTRDQVIKLWDQLLARFPVLVDVVAILMQCIHRVIEIAHKYKAEFDSLSSPQRILLIGALLLGFWLGRQKPFWVAYRQVADIPTRHWRRQKVLRGRVVTVTDGDTFRFYHTPFGNGMPKRGLVKKLSDCTVPVRICGIDAPEIAKFGKPGQPLGEQAKHALQKFLTSTSDVVYLRLLQKDMYNRVVAQVYKKRPWYLGRSKRHADEHMLQLGLAEVYEGRGAVYGPKGKRKYMKMQDVARSKELGIWGLKNRESAAEFKQRQRASSAYTSQ